MCLNFASQLSGTCTDLLLLPLSPRSSVKSFLRAVSCFLRWLTLGASWCHHLIVEVPRVPRVFRKSSRGSEMLAPSSVLERNNVSISPIPSIWSHWIYLSYNSPQYYWCQNNRKELLYWIELTGKLSSLPLVNHSS